MSLSPTAQAVSEGLPRLLAKYQGSNPQLGMITGMLQGMMMNLLPRIPEESLREQLIEVRDEFTLWIGDEDGIQGPLLYDTSYDVPQEGLEIVEEESVRRPSTDDGDVPETAS